MEHQHLGLTLNSSGQMGYMFQLVYIYVLSCEVPNGGCDRVAAAAATAEPFN